MFAVTVRDTVMIAHSLKGEAFGPAQRLHGATYVVEVTMRRPALDGDGVVADIGRATALLGDVLAPFAYRNLDEMAAFAGRNSTTEAMAETIFRDFAEGVRAGRLGGDAATAVESLKVTLRETPDAWASYDGRLHD